MTSFTKFSITVLVGILLLAVLGQAKQPNSASKAKSNKLISARFRRTHRVFSSGVNSNQNAHDNPSIISSKPVVQEQVQSRIPLQAIKCILGGAIMEIALGTAYCWGNFMTYLPPHLRFLDGISYPGHQPHAVYVVPIIYVACLPFIIVGPVCTRVLGCANASFLGMLIFIFSIRMASYQSKLQNFVLYYSCLSSVGSGVAYVAPLIAGWKWMPNSKGLVSGTILLGYGMGAFIFNRIGSRIANPLGFNINPIDGSMPASVYERFPLMLRRLSTMYLALAVVGCLMISEPIIDENGNMQIKRLGFNFRRNNNVSKQEGSLDHIKESKEKMVSSTGIEKSWGPSTLQSVKRHQFWMIWLMFISSLMACLSLANVYKVYAGLQVALSDDYFLSMAGGVAALFNGFGRLLWGVVADKLGFKKTYLLANALQVLVMITFQYTTKSKALFLATTCLSFFCLAGNFSILPLSALKIFGPRAGPQLYSYLFSAASIASLAGGVLSTKLVDALGWSGTFRVLSGITAFSLLVASRLQPLHDYELSST